MRAQAPLWAVAALAAAGCQDYPFEERPEQRVDAKKINEVIATVAPADILFVIDNSGSMAEEIAELQANVGLFIEEMAKSENQFQVGVITTDVECNVPTKNCSGSTSRSCCAINADDTTGCDVDTDGDGTIDRSTCDGGRLRAPPGKPDLRIFRPPDEADRAEWVADFNSILSDLGTSGSSYEAGLEAARRAVACAVGDPSCDPRDRAVADLNAGFIREEADLVLIFLTDEDDCSVTDREAYARPSNEADPLLQELHFCSPDECYAHYARPGDTCAIDGDCASVYSCNPALGLCELDSNQNHLMTWADSSEGSGPAFFSCGSSSRQVNPPEPDLVSQYLDRLVRLKGGDVSKVRAAGIVSSVEDPTAPLGSSRAGCVNTVTGASRNCGCWASSLDAFYCQLTQAVDQTVNRVPSESGGAGGGCTAMPSGRYVRFLETLRSARVGASLRPDTLLDSICRSRYDDTMFDIVNTIILTDCFDLGLVPAGPEDLVVKLNNEELHYVSVCDEFVTESRCAANECIWDPSANGGLGGCEPPANAGDADSGWSWRAGASKICLEGGLKKRIGDEFEIFLITGSE